MCKKQEGSFSVFAVHCPNWNGIYPLFAVNRKTWKGWEMKLKQEHFMVSAGNGWWRNASHRPSRNTSKQTNDLSRLTISIPGCSWYNDVLCDGDTVEVGACFLLLLLLLLLSLQLMLLLLLLLLLFLNLQLLLLSLQVLLLSLLLLLLPASCFLLPVSCFLFPASCFLLPKHPAPGPATLLGNHNPSIQGPLPLVVRLLLLQQATHREKQELGRGQGWSQV